MDGLRLWIFLREDGRNGVIGGVGFEDDLSVGVEVSEDGGRSECCFQVGEGFLACRRPYKFDVLLSEIGEWFCDLQVV